MAAKILTSDQVNYLIWRYLQESGFRDSAYTFQHDSKADRLDDIFKPRVRSGFLIYLIQRGLQYEELAALVDRDGTTRKLAKSFQFPPAPMVLDEDEGVGTDNGHIEEEEDDEDTLTIQSKSPPVSSVGGVKKHGIDGGVNGVARKRRKRVSPAEDGDAPMADAAGVSQGEPPRITNGRSVGTQIETVVEVSQEDTLVFGAQEQTISFCAWNPQDPTVLATASLKGGAQIWVVPPEASSLATIRHISIGHGPSQKDSAGSNITAISWSPEGSWLASGSFDGQTSIWSMEGTLEHNMFMHNAPVASLKWNNDSSILMALSCNGRMIAWDTAHGEFIKAFEIPEEAAVSVEWVSKTQFIASSDRGGLYMFDIVEEEPMHSRTLHDGDIDCLQWDRVTETLATGGRDASIIVWHRPGKDTDPDDILRGHAGPIVALTWQPNPNFIPAAPKRILASGSSDCTVRLWDTVKKSCLRILQLHQGPVNDISFSPDGQRLGSGDSRAIFVWGVDSGEATHVYDRLGSKKRNGTVAPEDEGEVGPMSWDESGSRLAIVKGDRKCAVVRIGSKAAPH